MSTYISLVKLTDTGVKEIWNSHLRIEQESQEAEAQGGKVIAAYATMGEYDYIIISEYPNDALALSQNLTQAAHGITRTVTLKAFSMGEFTEILKKQIS